MPNTEGGDKNWKNYLCETESMSKSYENENSLCIWRTTQDIRKWPFKTHAACPGIGILRGFVLTFTFMIPKITF